jgi:PAS domain S-box-containing protein
MIGMAGMDGYFTWVNPAFSRILGWETSDLLAQHLVEFVHPDDRERTIAAEVPLGRGEALAGFTNRCRCADGSYRWIAWTITPHPGEGILYIVGRDVTERRRLEERYQQVEHAAPIGLALVAPDGRFLRVNPALCALVGYAEAELLASTFRDITHPDDLDADLERVRQLLAGEIATYQIEQRYLRQGGALVWVLLSVSLVRDEVGIPDYFISQIQDMTKHKRAAEALEAARVLADRRAAAFATLVEVGAAFAAEREPRALCRLAVAQLASRFGYDLVSIYLREGDALRLQAQHGYDTVLDPLPLDAPGVAARTMRTSATHVIPDTAADPDFLGAVPGIAAEICVPLLVGGRAAGILNVESRTLGVLDHEAQELFELLARQLAIILENVALQHEETRRTERLGALQSVTAALAAVRTPAAVAQVVVDQGRAALGAVAAVVRLLSADGAWLELTAIAGAVPEISLARARLPVDDRHPLCEVVRSGRPLWSHAQATFQAHFPDGDRPWHAAADLQGAAILPLVVDERTIGALALSFATAQAFDSGDRDSLLTLAHAAAQTLERARLDAVERERARAAEESARLRAAQAEAMDTISVALSGTLEPERLYTLILEQAVRLLPSDHAAVLVYEDGWATVAATWGSPAPSIGTRLFPVAGPNRPWLPTDRAGAVYLADTMAEPTWVAYPPFVDAHRIRSALSAPLVIDGVAVGLLNVHSVVPGCYRDGDLPLATAFAERVCQALRNARLYRAEQERRQAAEDLAKLRSDFLASVSHELRTPLTAIVGFAELLRERWTVMDHGRRENYMDRIVASANRQLRLVQDLLDTSRVEAGALQCARAPIRLRALLERAAAEVEVTYRGQRVDLDGPSDALALGDAERALQVLINLMDNAAKYSPEGSPVTVTWQLEGGLVAVRVRDHGPGIAEAGRAALFTRFGRLPKSRMRAGRIGTGLGLYLSQLLAEAMDGDLCLETTGPDGSTFRLRLPAYPTQTREWVLSH